jgi:hypothetical protein
MRLRRRASCQPQALSHALSHALSPITAQIAVFGSVLGACTSRPRGYRDATAEEAAKLVHMEARLAASCSERNTSNATGSLAGSFLAEVQPHGPAVSFQMEGAWKDAFESFEAQFLSPLGEAWAHFSLGKAGTDIRYSGTLTGAQREHLRTFVDMLATLGAQNLRQVTCGRGLLRLQERRLFAPQSAAASSGMPQAIVRTLARGTLAIAGSQVSVQTLVDVTAGTVRLESELNAGLWGARGGNIQWQGSLPSNESLGSPSRLVVEQGESQGASLTFLEYE